MINKEEFSKKAELKIEQARKRIKKGKFVTEKEAEKKPKPKKVL